MAGRRIALRARVSNCWKTALLLVPTLGILQASAAPAQGPDNTVRQFEQKAGIEQLLDAQLPLDAKFKDEQGNDVTIGKYFKQGKPVILTLNYYSCPMLCTLILNSFVTSATNLPFRPARDYEVITLSFDPANTPELAAQKKATYVEAMGLKDAEATGWHFLTGTTGEIRRVTDAAGFKFYKDTNTGEFVHSAAIFVATPQGRLSHYFFGLDYNPTALRLALTESSQGKIGSPKDKLLIFCFLHYDPATGKYGPAIMKILRTACIVTLLLVVTFVAVALRGERRKPKEAAA